MHWLLDRFHNLTITTLIVFMIGALRKFWTWKVYEHVSEAILYGINILSGVITSRSGLRTD